MKAEDILKKLIESGEINSLDAAKQEGFIKGWSEALRMHDVGGRSEQLPCGECKPMEYDVEGIRYFKCRTCGKPMR